MEDKLEQHLAEIVEALKQGIDFASEQAPLFIQEYMAYSEIFHWVMIPMGLLFVILFSLMGKYFWKKAIDNPYEIWELPSAFSGIIAIGGLVVSVANTIQLIKLYVAPRVYLIEKISELL